MHKVVRAAAYPRLKGDTSCIGAINACPNNFQGALGWFCLAKDPGVDAPAGLHVVTVDGAAHEAWIVRLFPPGLAVHRPA